MLTVVAAWLIAQNSHPTTVQWLSFDFDVPRWLVLGVTLVIGAVIWEVCKPRKRGTGVAIRAVRQRRRARSAE